MKTTPAQILGDSRNILALDGTENTWRKVLGKCWDMKPDNIRTEVLPLSKDWMLRNKQALGRVSACILDDVTATRHLTSGTPSMEHLRSLGVCPIVKSDGGLVTFHRGRPGEQVSVIKPGFEKWLEQMSEKGAVATKYRTVCTLNPSDDLLKACAHNQTENVLATQKFEMIPVTEPEVPAEHGYPLDEHAMAMLYVLDAMYHMLEDTEADLSNTVLKTGFAANGQLHKDFSEPSEVAAATLKVISDGVPKQVKHIVFLSGGWAPPIYCEYLNATVKLAKEKDGTLVLGASASRAAVQEAYTAWQNEWERLSIGIEVLNLRAGAIAAACTGTYKAEDWEPKITKLLVS